MENMVFARIAWHPRYDGQYPLPYTGADWKEKVEGEFAEWQNFKELNRKCYGWVKPSGQWRANLTNVGGKPGDKSVKGITVVWVATDPIKGGSKIVGWYENAKMYDELRERPKPLRNHYLFEAKTSHCFLLEDSQRVFEIDHRFRNLWYAKEEKFKKLKQKVLAYINGEYDDQFHDPVEPYFSAAEGRKILRKHLKAERSSKLVKEFKRSLNSYACSVCKFDFGKTYGDLGEGFIEAHHTKAVSDLKPNEEVSTKDFKAVCSNCHRMLHRQIPPYTVEQLRAVLNNIS
jgi:5-methylcytosine-specific restriction enzyme A